MGTLGSLTSQIRHQFPALAVRNFRLFVLGQVVSLTGTWMQGPALKWVVFDITHSSTALGMVDFLGQLPVTLLVLLAGVLADRYPRVRIMIGTQIALTVIAFGFGCASLAGHLTIGVIYALSVLSGIAQAIDVPARQACVSEMVGREAMANAVAINSATFNSARIIGPSVGGLVFAAAGATWCFFINAISFLPVIGALFAIKGLPARKRPAGRGLSNLADGLKYVRRHPHLKTLLILTGVFGLFGNWYMTLLPQFAADIYGKGPKEYGLLISAIGVGAFVGAIVAAVTSKGSRIERRAVAGILLMCVTTLALAFVRRYWAAVALVTVSSFGMMTFLVASNILIQTLSAQDYVGRVIGVRHFVFGGMFPFGAICSGLMAEHLGAQRAVALGTLVLFVVALALLRRMLTITGEPEQAGPAG